MPPQRPGEPRSGESTRRTVQVRDFKGMNATDARTAIDDTEFAWLENAMPIGKGKIKILPSQGVPIYTDASVGIANLFGVVFKNVPQLVVIRNDGSVKAVDLAGNVTAVANAASVTSSVDVSLWQGNVLLFEDPTKGYLSWDGTTFTVIDNTRLGTSIAVFGGRAWLGNVRTLQYTDAGSYTSFAGAGGSAVITDEAFPGNIVRLISALEQLWILGGGAVNAISNVSINSLGATVFSNTNIVTGIGTQNRQSVIAFFRALAFMSQSGVYGLVGVTPQKLSDKLDGLFPDLVLTPDTPAALATVYQLPVLCMLCTYNDPLRGPRPLLLCVSQGKTFVASQGNLKALTCLTVGSSFQAWGTDGTTIYPLFSNPNVPTTYRIQAKLFDFGSMVRTKDTFRVMLEYETANIVAPQLTMETESGTQSVTLNMGNAVQWANIQGQTVPFVS